ncbi:Helicase swr1 [Elsinoe australis]|uniref:DNA helicase n=1 Tax=Elsinoe australis TaxID=40998 RepID=A0A2P7ZZX8_9PEZI|nr:Helicase swr1 [Elsinoe australis]
MPDALPVTQDDTNADSAVSPPINGINGHPPEVSPDAPITNEHNHETINGIKEEEGSKDEAQQTISTPASAPHKKRKLDDLNGRSRSASRAASPPWKSFAADGPTQFTTDGKRRSGRVNTIPLELQPPSDKRTTRKAYESTTGSKRRKTAADVTTPRSSKLKTELSSSPPKPSSLRKPSSKAEVKDVPQPTRVSSRVKTSPKHLDGANDERQPRPEGSPPAKRRVGRPPKKRDHTPPSPDARRAKRESITNGVDELRAKQSSPRLRLKLPRHAMYPRHPDFIPKPPKFGSLIEVLETYDAKEREIGPGDKDEGDMADLRAPTTKVTQSAEELAHHEARTRLRILDAAKPGGALSEDRCSLFFPDAQEQLPAQYSHNDHLWAHGTYFRTLMRREKARHMELAKKTAHACLAKWKEKQPQTEEERAREENEWFRLMYKQTVKDVARKWELVTGEIERQRFQKWIEEQELTRDRKMQDLLESTTAMLERRRVGFENEDEDGEGSEVSEDSEEGSTGDSTSGGTVEEDDDMMSSSQSEDDAGAEADLDTNLSPEALRAKYADLPDLENEEDEDSNDDDNDEDASESGAPDDIQAEPSGIADMSHVPLDEVDDALMDDEDDESIDMSDDMGSSDEDSEEEEGEDSQGEDEDEDIGLMGFLGGRERRQIEELPEDGSVKDVGEVDAMEGIIQNTDTAALGLGDENKAMDTDVEETENSSNPTLQPALSTEGDHSSQPTPMDSSTAAMTEAESTTTIDPEEVAKIMPMAEETQSGRKITTKVPSLLRGNLREYQHYGLDWLAKLYANQTNGILADEMGLGKTIQTIALLAHLAEEHEVWGPHLIVVPTSVILNWEMEFKKFLPGFKVLSYYGTQEERHQKRKGWSNPDNYNVVITSYQLILKDLSSIRVPEWHYMILDEAHNIKNFQSQRYQAMIRLKTHARLLLTGTPLQNSIQELWSLLTFLTAGQDGQGMGDLDEFTQWFKRPVDEIFVDGKNKLGVEAQEIVSKLHHSLRPYILRRMKAQVEKQLPGKYEHTIFCRLSKRQRQLYDAFLSRTDVKEKLSSGNPISVSQALMALRKVCNHPDLFEERPIVTSFTVRKPYSRMPRSVVADYEIKDFLVRRQLLQVDVDHDFDSFIERNFDLRRREQYSKYHAGRGKRLSGVQMMRNWLHHFAVQKTAHTSVSGTSLEGTFASVKNQMVTTKTDKLQNYIDVTEKRAEWAPIFGSDLVAKCTVRTSDRLQLLKSRLPPKITSPPIDFEQMSNLSDMVQSSDRRATGLNTQVQKFAFVTPNAVAHDVLQHSIPPAARSRIQELGQTIESDPYHEARVRLSIAFPDKRLLQYDCGKLQRLAVLLRELTDRGSRALIFTQMTSVLDILERFLNIHGYKYMRLDGSTRIEQRQDMMERFNRDERIDVFILSSRSGGVGMNLTGADSVIFYDLDWNPQMDKQCQDRAHRIGQTRDVHIYKMVSEHTIEVNILKKSNQKRMLDEVVIQEGEFTTDFFNKADDLADNYEADDFAGAAVDKVLGLDRRDDVGKVLAAAEEVIDVEAAKAQQKEAYIDDADFDFDKHGKTSASGAATPAVTAEQSLLGGESMAVDEGTDERPHVDDYMLRFVERMLEKVPFVPPVDKSKKGRLDKNGRDRSHRPKKV